MDNWRICLSIKRIQKEKGPKGYIREQDNIRGNYPAVLGQLTREGVRCKDHLHLKDDHDVSYLKAPKKNHNEKLISVGGDVSKGLLGT